MKRFISSLLVFGFCGGGNAITPQQIHDRMRELQQQGLAGRPGYIAGILSEALGVSGVTASEISMLNAFWRTWNAGEDTTAYQAQILAQNPAIAPAHPPHPAPAPKPTPKPSLGSTAASSSTASTSTEPTVTLSSVPGSPAAVRRVNLKMPTEPLKQKPVNPRGDTLAEIRAAHLPQASFSGVSAPRSDSSTAPRSTTKLAPTIKPKPSTAPIPHLPALSAPQEDWLQHAFLIGTDGDAVAGFEGISKRLEVFNPLYKQSFPNVPIVHQYHPLISSSGGFFPLVVRIDPLFIPLLPPTVQTRFHPSSTYELYWVVQNAGSVNAVDEEGGDALVFRPQYWVQPNGQPTTFHADVQLLDPQGGYHHLPNLKEYSIHDGVASPNAPTIPFQDQLKSGNSCSFWSLTTHGNRSALTYHWIVDGNDDREIKDAIKKSATLKDLLIQLKDLLIQPHPQQKRFTNSSMIAEVESIFGQN